MSLQTTSSQTIGPYLHIGLRWLVSEDMTSPATIGEKFTIEGDKDCKSRGYLPEGFKEIDIGEETSKEIDLTDN